jgi:hypothetical protein
MGESRREAFLKRLSTVGFGARESIEVMLSDIVHDIREQVIQKRFREEEMDQVAEFHDLAEDLWRGVVKTDPPIAASALTKRMRELLLACVGPLAQYQRRIEHGVRAADEFEKAH